MADAIVSSFSPPPTAPNRFRRGVEDQDISVDVGMPLSPGSGAIFAKANAGATANVMGLAATAGEYPGHVDVQYGGPLTLTTAQWDRVTGQTGGLTPHSIYYLSAATAGLLTTVAPGGSNYITPVGFALSATTMMVQIGTAVVASP